MGYRCRRHGAPAYIYNDELYHFGVSGQKWGVRRYQNEDGSYKAGAEGRYSPSGTAGGTSMRARSAAADSRAMDIAADVDRRHARRLYDKAERARARGNDRKADRLTRKADRLTSNADRVQKEFRDRAERASGAGRASGGGSNGSYAARRSGAGSEGGGKGLSPKAKKALLTAAGVAAAGAAAYGGYRLAKSGAAKGVLDNIKYERDVRARANANGEKYVKSRVVGEGPLDKMRGAASSAYSRAKSEYNNTKAAYKNYKDYKKSTGEGSSGAFGKAKGVASDAYSRAKSEYNNTKAAYKNYKDYTKSTGSSAKDVFGKAKDVASDAYSRAKSEGNNMKAVYKNYRDLKQQERDAKGKARKRKNES